MGFGFLVEKGQDKRLTLKARNDSEVLPEVPNSEQPLATVIVNERG